MCSDLDIKIAGDKPSRDIKKNNTNQNDNVNLIDNDFLKAKQLGKIIAEKFINDSKDAMKLDDSVDMEMIIERRLLLSFTATVGFEQYCINDSDCGIAQKSFLDTIKDYDYELYKTSGDTGAFSFYYLAYRRGTEIDRRIGQTFAMLCSHDGDPIYQELGEALYCWFLSVVKKAVKQLELS